MTATVFIETSIAKYDKRIDCEEVKIIGDLVWAIPEGDEREVVVPTSNVAGVTGDVVAQEIEAIEAPGGQFTELVTDVS